MKLMGYRRANGSFGIRNYVAVLPSVFCANHAAQKIAERVNSLIAAPEHSSEFAPGHLDGCIGLPHQLGCGQHGKDLDQTVRTLIGLGCNPNIGAVLLVGLGCERMSVQELYDGIAPTGKPVRTIVIQECGGTDKTIEKGVEIASELAAELAKQEREEFDESKLLVGLKCGGTDALSGIAANPALGLAVDRLIDGGGSAMLTEIGELVGAEHLLAKRGINEEVAKRIREIILHTEEVQLRMTEGYEKTGSRAALVTPGNFEGGVTTVSEKALGGILKSGHRPFVGTLEYSERPDLDANPGLYLMNAEGQDGEVVTPMAAAGAQIVCFTSGRGTPTGFPFVPVIKITGNDHTFHNMEGDIDINAGTFVTGEKTLAEVGDEIYGMIEAVANGMQTKPERGGHCELFTIGRYEMY